DTTDDAITDTVTLATLSSRDEPDPGTAASAPDASASEPTSSTATTTTTTELEAVDVQLDIAPQFLGFAGTQGLTGGMGHPVVLVTTADDAGPGSYREALSGGQRIVRFDPALAGETIHLQDPVEVTGSDLTLDGSGVDVTVSGHATRFSGTNIVVAGMRYKY